MPGAPKTRFQHAKTTAFPLVAAGLFVLSAVPAFSAFPDGSGPPPFPETAAEVRSPARPPEPPASFSPIPAEAWNVGESKWVAEGHSVALAGHGFSVAAVPAGLELEMRATVRPVRCRSQASSALGLVAYGSPGECWRLALVKTSDRQGSIHRFELRAMSGGAWGRERTGARLLEIRDCGVWKYGRDYEFTLRRAPDRTVGQIADAESGEVLFRAVYGPAPGPEGEKLFAESGLFGLRPALCVDGRFRGLAWHLRAKTEGEPAHSAEEAAAGLATMPGPGGKPRLGRYALECCEKAWAAILAANSAGGDPLAQNPATAAPWKDDGKLGASSEPDWGPADGREARLRSLSADVPAAAGPFFSRNVPAPFACAALDAPPSGDGGLLRHVDRRASAPARAAPGGHDHGDAKSDAVRSPALAGSGVPVDAHLLKDRHAPPPEEVAAGPPAAA